MNRIEELTALLEAATPGPWYADNRGDEIEIVGKADNARRYGVDGEWNVAKIEADPFERDVMPCEANARFIAAAPQAVRDLLEVVKAAQTMLDDGVSCEDFPERDFIVEREHAEALRKAMEALK